MDWLLKHWKPLAFIFAGGLFVAQQEADVMELSEFKQEDCVRWCLELCQEGCRSRNVTEQECDCRYCYYKCGN